MLRPRFVGWLRRVGIWTVGQKVHRLLGPPICAGIHAAVGTLGRYLPDDLVLKHHYDYHPVHLDPKLITSVLLVDAGLKPSRLVDDGRLARYRRWRSLGGGWKSASRHVTRNFHGRFIADGDWDVEAEPFQILPTIVELFVEGRKPEETTDYQKYVRWVEEKDFVWTRDLRSIEDIDRYFDRLAQLFEDIRIGGYRTQADLGNDGSDEIRVCIDSGGRPTVFGGGTHRLSIALLLEVERVPVLVKRIHATWSAECARRYGGTTQTAIARGMEELEKGIVLEAADSRPERDEPPAEKDRQPPVHRNAQYRS